MASPNETAPSKRRLGRRRLPPLEPGPALQFVIANHPDEFRAGKTMRHVRSHVMYKHRTDRKTSTNGRANVDLHRSTSEHASNTPSPTSSTLEAPVSDIDYLEVPPSRPRSSTWTRDQFYHTSYDHSPPSPRTLIHRILSSTLGSYARSAPPMFEDASTFPFPVYHSYDNPLDDLKQQYIESCAFPSPDKGWMSTVCVDQISFLSHVSVSSIYQDLMDGFWYDSSMTVQAKTHALRAMAGQLESNNATILSILHLLLSEVGGDESAFGVHYRGLQGLIQRRGGLDQLPVPLVTYVTLILTSLAALRPLPSPNPTPAFNQIPSNSHDIFLYISPFHAPYGDLSPLRAICPSSTLELLTTTYSLTQTLLHAHTTHQHIVPTRHHYLTHERILYSRPAYMATPQDWIHEAIRIAALIQSHAILHHTSLATAANTPYHDDPSADPGTTRSTTFLVALLNAVRQTDASTSWGALRGVFLWVCILGGAAAWGSTSPALSPGGISLGVSATSVVAAGSHDANAEMDGPSRHTPLVAWARKCFSLWAVRAVVSSGFEHAGGLEETLRCGVKVRETMDGWDGSEMFGLEGSGGV